MDGINIDGNLDNLPKLVLICEEGENLNVVVDGGEILMKRRKQTFY